MELDNPDLKSLLLEALQEHYESIINSHHVLNKQEVEWIRESIEAQKERRRMYRAFTRIFISWSIPTLLTGILVWLQSGHWPKIEL